MHTFLTLDAMHEIIWGDENVPELKMDFKDEELRFLLVLSALLHDIGKCYCSHQGIKHHEWEFEGEKYEEDIPKVSDHPQTGLAPAEEFCRNLKMSNDEIHFICSIVARHMDAHELSAKKHFHDILEFVHHPKFKEIMLVALADEKGGVKIAGFDPRGCVAEIMKDERVIKAMSMDIPEPVLTGNDLIEFGRKPGPLFRKMLDVAHAIQIDQGITDKKMLYRMVKNVELSKDEM
jgi:hypothetical protein